MPRFLRVTRPDWTCQVAPWPGFPPAPALSSAYCGAARGWAVLDKPSARFTSAGTVERGRCLAPRGARGFTDSLGTSHGGRSGFAACCLASQPVWPPSPPQPSAGHKTFRRSAGGFDGPAGLAGLLGHQAHVREHVVVV